ncbi:MAG: hypothetical protein JXA24_03075 [Proteobacteria bacterium]|nr:hypothetical protein [Pseudomonadota bacterium]
MRFYADIHVHSKYSRATARNCDLENLALWAGRKGIAVVGTGDFTHPAWFGEIRRKLSGDGSGLFTLRGDDSGVRFILSVEISTIYKKGDAVRKVHHVICVPSFEAAEKISRALGRIGNISSDGRPILGLDSRDLLEIVLESDPGSFLVPAHIWTPWFSALGSKSGFDSIDECYADLAGHIFAVETGLSSDPAMNWRVSSLDRFRLVSNSDAHSPQKLGREASIFDCESSYGGIMRALKEGEGYVGAVEFFPEEGKYHADGHRGCGVRLTPAETRRLKGICPVCSRPLTVGVLHRVEELADRPAGSQPPATAGEVKSLVPLCEIVSEIMGRGPATKGVLARCETLLEKLGSELAILTEVPTEEIGREWPPLAEAMARLRRGEVFREAGYDGEYGTIRLFGEGELAQGDRL